MQITRKKVVAAKVFGYAGDDGEISRGVQFKTSERIPATITFMKSGSINSVSVDLTESSAEKIGRKLEDLPDFVLRSDQEGYDSDGKLSASW
jgi:hypothetical protein